MSISHWGIVPGWWTPIPEANGSYRLGDAARYRWRRCGFDELCAVQENIEQRAADELAELRRQRRAFLDS